MRFNHIPRPLRIIFVLLICLAISPLLIYDHLEQLAIDIGRAVINQIRCLKQGFDSIAEAFARVWSGRSF